MKTDNGLDALDIFLELAKVTEDGISINYLLDIVVDKNRDMSEEAVVRLEEIASIEPKLF